MTRLRVGVIGLGLGTHHTAAYAMADEVDRLVVCDPDRERLDRARAAHDKVHATYESAEEMFASERLDAVSIVTPDHLHRPQAEAAFEAGCHVLLTKPLATTLDDARAIIRRAEASGRTLMITRGRVLRDGIEAPEELPSDQRGIVFGTAGCVASFLRSILQGVPVAVSGRDAFASLAACVAADESCARATQVTPAPEDFD